MASYLSVRTAGGASDRHGLKAGVPYKWTYLHTYLLMELPTYTFIFHMHFYHHFSLLLLSIYFSFTFTVAK